ncbi:hypothetical protein SAMN00790413_05606 [Deinococcus hopiensis KR-140]|uniref:Uncharacterized protein n=2 Tax=Deinococcus TaxID=1298 RepID=A0A1W1UD16_9DEIO|nr:hypothetical protein SAMN00790413_05606 [Deinococcus hopiensis KR-140]
MGELLQELGLSQDLEQALTELQLGERQGDLLRGHRDVRAPDPILPRALLTRLNDFHILHQTLARTPLDRLHYAQLEHGTETGKRAVEGLELELARRGLFPAGGFRTEVARAQMESAHDQAQRASLAALSLLDQVLRDEAGNTEPSGCEELPPHLPLPGLLAGALRSAVRLPPVLTTPLTLPALPPVHLPRVLTTPVTLPQGMVRLLTQRQGTLPEEDDP